MQENINMVNSGVENTVSVSVFSEQNMSSTPSTPSTPSTSEEWDLEIKPQAHLLDINLREVWKYRDLLWMFVKRDFTVNLIKY
jgi:hypothetical protein